MLLLWTAISLLSLALGAPSVSLESDTEPSHIPGSDVDNTEDLVTTGEYDGGDLKLTPRQRQYLHSGRSSYKVYAFASGWANAVVPYVIREYDFSSSDLKEIKEAMWIWERDTCVRFVPRTDERDWVQIQDGKEGCNSYLGNIGQGMQPLNLRDPGCMAMGTYLHELGHALGLIHEHQRPDRDQYVRYYEENVNQKRIDNMKKYKHYYVKDYGVEFDLSSIMLYSLGSFSANKKDTLGVDNTFYHEHINGRRYRHLLSFGDIKVINAMYKCKDRCDKNVDCPEPGFVNERCECVTQESYLKQRCKNNPEYEDWCDNRAIYGYCDRKDTYQQRHCMKSCDFCPIFAPGTSGLVKPTGCFNAYSNDAKCDEWARKGYCHDYPAWVQRHCRKSCDQKEKTCSKQIGICANKLSDNECESYANSIWWNYCGRKEHWAREAQRLCPDSCKTCPA